MKMHLHEKRRISLHSKIEQVMINENTYIMYHVILIGILEDPTFW
jgi:hypothetical protein